MVVHNNQAYSIAVLIDDLRSEDITVRLRSLEQLELIAQALGPVRSREELVPFVMDMSDDEDEVLSLIASKLGRMVDSIGGRDFAFHLIRPLEQLATVEEQCIRDSALDSLKIVCLAMDDRALADHFTPFVLRLSVGDWYISRISACNLASALLDKVFSVDVYRQLVELSREDTPKVRRAAFEALAAVSRRVPGHLWEDLCVTLERSSRDEEDIVRMCSMELVCAVLSTREDNIRKLSLPFAASVLTTVCDDPSWRVRNSVVDHCDSCLRNCWDPAFSLTIIRSVIKLVQDPDAEVRAAAVAKLTQCLKLAKDSQTREELLQSLERICRDSAELVRVSLAVNFCTADSCPEDLFIQYCLPALLLLVRDDSINVRIKILNTVKYLPEFIPPETFKLAILPSLRDIAVDKNWRIRKALLELLPEIFSPLCSAGSEDEILSWLEKFLLDPVYCVREASGGALATISASRGVNFFNEKILPIISSVMQSNSYLYRITGLLAVRQVLGLAVDNDVANAVFETIRTSATDSVANVRLNFIKVARDFTSHNPNLSNQVTALINGMDADADADVRTECKRYLKVK